MLEDAAKTRVVRSQGVEPPVNERFFNFPPVVTSLHPAGRGIWCLNTLWGTPFFFLLFSVPSEPLILLPQAIDTREELKRNSNSNSAPVAFRNHQLSRKTQSTRSKMARVWCTPCWNQTKNGAWAAHFFIFTLKQAQWRGVYSVLFLASMSAPLLTISRQSCDLPLLAACASPDKARSTTDNRTNGHGTSTSVRIINRSVRVQVSCAIEKEQEKKRRKREEKRRKREEKKHEKRKKKARASARRLLDENPEQIKGNRASKHLRQYKGLGRKCLASSEKMCCATLLTLAGWGWARKLTTGAAAIYRVCTKRSAPGNRVGSQENGWFPGKWKHIGSREGKGKTLVGKMKTLVKAADSREKPQRSGVS